MLVEAIDLWRSSKREEQYLRMGNAVAMSVQRRWGQKRYRVEKSLEERNIGEDEP